MDEVHPSSANTKRTGRKPLKLDFQNTPQKKEEKEKEGEIA